MGRCTHHERAWLERGCGWSTPAQCSLFGWERLDSTSVVKLDVIFWLLVKGRVRKPAACPIATTLTSLLRVVVVETYLKPSMRTYLGPYRGAVCLPCRILAAGNAPLVHKKLSRKKIGLTKRLKTFVLIFGVATGTRW